MDIGHGHGIWKRHDMTQTIRHGDVGNMSNMKSTRVIPISNEFKRKMKNILFLYQIQIYTLNIQIMVPVIHELYTTFVIPSTLNRAFKFDYVLGSN